MTQKQDDIRFLKAYLKDLEISGLFLPALFYENQHTSLITKPSFILLESPACTLEENLGEDYYHKGLLEKRKGHNKEALNYFELSREILAHYHHHSGLARVLLKMAQTNNKMQNYSKAIKNLKDIMDLAKSGDINLKMILVTHILFIQTFGFL